MRLSVSREEVMEKPHVYFSTAEDLDELLDCMSTVQQDDTQERAELSLQQACAESKENGSPKKYWDSIRIFRVTIEEVKRVKP